MAPEQVAGDTNLDARTDIYALGALAYEMLTGRAVFPRSNVADVLRAHLAEKPEPVSALRPGIPAALEAAVLQCLEKDPDRRPQSAAELLSRLDDPDVVSGAVSSAVAVTPLRRRPRALLMAAALVALVLGVATVSSVMSNAGESGATGSSAVAPVPTVAVLPLVAASGDSSDRYLAFGVTDEIISALAQARGIRVASRAAAEEAQRAGLSLAQLRERFAVTHALEGTIQRVGSDLRVAVRLLGTADGLTVWSEVFDASATDLLEVQRFIAQAIAAAVQEDLGGTPDTNAGTSTSQPPPNTPGTG
jgi:serine/threonine-protein kinase